MPTARAPKRGIALLSQLPADRKSVTRVRAFPEPVLPVIHQAWAYYCQRVIARERSHRSRIIVAPAKDYDPVGITDLRESLSVTTESRRTPLRITDDHPLIELPDESGCDWKAGTVGEVQDSLIPELVAARDHVRDPMFFLSDKLGWPNSSQDNLARERATWERRRHHVPFPCGLVVLTPAYVAALAAPLHGFSSCRAAFISG